MRGVWDRPWHELEVAGASILVERRDLATLVEVVPFCWAYGYCGMCYCSPYLMPFSHSHSPDPWWVSWYVAVYLVYVVYVEGLFV